MIIRSDPTKTADEWYDITSQVSPDAVEVPKLTKDASKDDEAKLRDVVSTAVCDAVREHIFKDADMEKLQKKHTVWALTFTKRLIIIVVLFYILANIYVGWAMIHYQTFDYLGQIYDKISTLVEVTIFGYLVKAGAENVPKIIQSNKNSREKLRLAAQQLSSSSDAQIDFPQQEIDEQ